MNRQEVIGYLWVAFLVLVLGVIVLPRIGLPCDSQSYGLVNRTITPTASLHITNKPAGIAYNGPPTTAIAGYYCVYNATVASVGYVNCTYVYMNGVLISSTCTFNPRPQVYYPPGYTIQLNAELSNGYWLQNAYGGAYEVVNGQLVILVFEQTWGVQGVLSTLTGPPAKPCGWLVISIRGGTAYFGYSSDGRVITWYASYPVGDALIVNGSYTNLVIAGPGDGAGVDFKSLYVVLAMWYWNGTAWVPAPVVPGGASGEYVLDAWVYTGANEAVVTWPEPAGVVLIPVVPPPHYGLVTRIVCE